MLNDVYRIYTEIVTHRNIHMCVTCKEKKRGSLINFFVAI